MKEPATVRGEHEGHHFRILQVWHVREKWKKGPFSHENPGELIKPTEKGPRKGTLAAVQFRSNQNMICIGWSKCHKSLDQFNTVLGTDIAVRRACGAFTRHIRILAREIPNDLIYPIKEFIQRLERRFPGNTFHVGGMFVGYRFPMEKLNEMDKFFAEKAGEVWKGNPHCQKGDTDEGI